jgi:hypothetical protein
MTRSISCLAGAAMAFLALPALAQTVPPAPSARISGTIESFDGKTLAVKTLDGRDISVALPADARITALANRTLADIKPGDFVGSAAVEGKDGKLHAQEVHIFPENMRGTGEGHRPMAGARQTMTNADVSGEASTPDGRVLTLKYPGGQQKIVVAPNVRIVKLISGDRSLLKPGAAVVVNAVKSGNGQLTAQSVQAEKDGVKPLM